MDVSAPANVPGTQNLIHGVTFGDMRAPKYGANAYQEVELRKLMRPHHIIMHSQIVCIYLRVAVSTCYVQREMRRRLCDSLTRWRYWGILLPITGYRRAHLSYAQLVGDILDDNRADIFMKTYFPSDEGSCRRSLSRKSFVRKSCGGCSTGNHPQAGPRKQYMCVLLTEV